mgnify:CR=1 FL=1
MRKIGFDVTEHVGKTGVVAVYRNGPGPTILVRTELDALPMEEKTGLPYASTIPGCFHGCGHDGHMAMLLGAAQALAADHSHLARQDGGRHELQADLAHLLANIFFPPFLWDFH